MPSPPNQQILFYACGHVRSLGNTVIRKRSGKREKRAAARLQEVCRLCYNKRKAAAARRHRKRKSLDQLLKQSEEFAQLEESLPPMESC